jgi:hypothetical protein
MAKDEKKPEGQVLPMTFTLPVHMTGKAGDLQIAPTARTLQMASSPCILRAVKEKVFGHHAANDSTVNGWL